VRVTRSSKETCSQGCGSGEPPLPRGVPAPHGKFVYREAPEAPRRCRQPPTEARVLGPGRRGSGSVPEAPAAETRSSTSGSPGGGDVRVLVRQGEDRPGGCGRRGRHGRQRLAPLHRELGGALPAGVIRPGRHGVLSSMPDRRMVWRWAHRLEALGLVVLRAWDRVAASAACSPAGNSGQTTPEGRSGQETPRVAAVLETATWQGSKPSRERETPRTERAG